MKNYDFKSKIEEIFNKSSFKCLASESKGTPWSCPLWIRKDNNWNLYFRSLANTTHMKNISKNKKISVSIYESNQSKPLRGIQIAGEAKILSKKKDIEDAIQYYLGENDDMSVEDYLNPKDFKLVQIRIKQMYIFDQEAFEEERKLVPNKFYKD